MGKVIDLQANGKLLIAGEYLVLAGAKALALPLRFGQRLRVEEVEEGVPGLLKWRSLQPAGVWFTCEVEMNGLQLRAGSDEQMAHQLVNMLHYARRLNPQFLSDHTGFSVVVEANYPIAWGFGSSSTLIHLVAAWARISAYTLYKVVSNGSGVDLACADRFSPIFYQIDGGDPVIEEAPLGTALKKYTWFGWLGKKQSSQREVDQFNRQKNFTDMDVSAISALSVAMAQASTFDELADGVVQHERIVGRILSKEPLSGRFEGFPGVVKSLGAWGGDFAMFVSEAAPSVVESYLHAHNIQELFTFEQIAAKRDN